MEITLREAQYSDYESILELYTEELAFHIELQPDIFQMAEPVMTNDWYKEQVDNEAVILYVAEVDGFVAGVIQVMIRNNPNDPIFQTKRYAHIEDIVVNHQYRGKGVGTLLMDAAQRWAKENGAFSIDLWVWIGNDDAVSFYSHLGYKTNRLSMQMRLNT